jgi:predicted ATPase
LSLARLRISQDRHEDAKQILAPVYDRFTEGFGTADLKQAKALLEQLA